MSQINPYQSPSAELGNDTGLAVEGQGLTPAMIRYLRECKPWVRFLSVSGFLVVGLLLLGGIGVLVGSAFRAGSDAQLLLLGGIFYLVTGSIMLLPSLQLFRFADAIGALAHGVTAKAVEEVLQRQRTFWRTVGIMTLVLFVLYVIGFAALFVGVLVSAAGLD